MEQMENGSPARAIDAKPAVNKVGNDARKLSGRAQEMFAVPCPPARF
jgi:hypothetical protein